MTSKIFNLAVCIFILSVICVAEDNATSLSSMGGKHVTSNNSSDAGEYLNESLQMKNNETYIDHMEGKLYASNNSSETTENLNESFQVEENATSASTAWEANSMRPRIIQRPLITSTCR